jgi:hypothetical protein
MAKEKEERAEGKPKRKHLHEVRTEQAEDGTYVHHHTYKDKKGGHPEPERRNVATSKTPEEAGEHTTEQFGMNDQGEGDPGGAPAEGDEAQGAGAGAGAGDPMAAMAGGGTPGG